jgi:uncharacterized membrane protein YeiH
MVIYALDLFGTFAFAVSGAFRAVKYELDLLGVLVLAVSTGVGGGIVRDLLLGASPPAAFQNETYLLTCFLGGLVVFVAAPRIASHWDSVMLADAVGLSVFAAIGASKASAAGWGVVGILMIAALTATGGGVIRDVLVHEIPSILKSDFYATAAVVGGAVFVLLRTAGLGQRERLAGTIVATLVLRLWAMNRAISLPHVKRLPGSPSFITGARRKARPGRKKADAGG